MKKFITLFIFLIITSNLIYSVKLVKKYDKFDECDIYEADEDTELNFYIYIPKDKSKKPYMILKTNLMTVTGLINYNKIIIISNNNKKTEITIDTKTESEMINRAPMIGANGMMMPGTTMYLEKALIILNNEQIDFYSNFFADVKTAEIRFVGIADNKDVEIDYFEMNWIKAIFKKWKEINIE